MRSMDVIKVSYSRGKIEASYSLENATVNHGIVLELIVLFSKYDICLQQHVNSCIDNSKKQHESGAKAR